MKIIFLDIDGVLNSQRSMLATVGQPVAIPQANFAIKGMAERQAKLLDPVAVGLLNRLTDADRSIKLVISSTHRMFAMKNGVVQPDLLCDYMAMLGVTGDVLDATPRLDLTRGEEIHAWLETNAVTFDDCIIIDDDSDMLEYQWPRFVHCNGEAGFALHDFLLAQQLLGITDAQLFEGSR